MSTDRPSMPASYDTDLSRESDPVEPLYSCPACGRVAPWTDGLCVADGDERDEFWCQTCGAETPLELCDVAIGEPRTGGEEG